MFEANIPYASNVIIIYLKLYHAMLVITFATLYPSLFMLFPNQIYLYRFEPSCDGNTIWVDQVKYELALKLEHEHYYDLNLNMDMNLTRFDIKHDLKTRHESKHENLNVGMTLR